MSYYVVCTRSESKKKCFESSSKIISQSQIIGRSERGEKVNLLIIVQFEIKSRLRISRPNWLV